MTISKKAEYALRAVVIMAAAPPDRPVQLQDLAETGKIPQKFLEQIMLTLKRGGLLRSKRGVGGGYHLEKPARQITVADVISLIDGGLSRLAENGEAMKEADFPGARGLNDSLEEIDSLVNIRLASLTIEKILERDEPDAMFAFGI